MKKFFAILLTIAMMFLMTACGGEATPTNLDNSPATFRSEESTENSSDEETQSSDDTSNGTSEPGEFDELDEIVLKEVEDTIAVLATEYDKLTTDIDTYDRYLGNADKVEAFYGKILEDTKYLCIKMREYSIDYAELIISSDKSNDEKYEDFDELYDSIYEDASDEIYDGIYDGLLDDMYDAFYDGILEDSYEDAASYEEWSDACSNEYEWWSDTSSDVYKEWSGFSSDVYEFWSDMKGEMWDDDTEKAEDVIKDFQEDIEKLKNGDAQSDNDNSEQTENDDTFTEEPEETTPANEPEDNNSSEELVDGMRSEFKAAMDSYEAFYDEYCDFMKEYADNPTDLGLLADYADMMSEAADMSEKFDAWSEDEMNNAELKYYLEVSNRVAQKLLEVVQ